MPTETEKAVEFRRKMQAREDNRLARELAMAGDPIARAALQAKADPLLPWKGWDPIRRVKGEPE